MADEVRLIDLVEEFISGDWGEESVTENTPCAVSCVRGADIVPISNSRFENIPVRYISTASLKNRGLSEGDIIIEKSGGSPTQSTGRTVYVSKKLVEAKKSIVCSNFCQAFRIKQGWNPLFVYYFLQVVYNSGVFFNFEGKTSGLKNLILDSAFQSITIKKVPLEEQDRVANMLSLIDEKIAANHAINDYLEAMAQQLYDFWFVQFDFPDENGKPYKSSGGKMVWNDKLKRAIPEGWIVARLSDFIEEHISGDWGNDNLADSCMPVSCIRGADMKTMDDLPLRYIPVSHTDRLLHDGDIVIEMSGGSPTQSTGRSVCITSRIIEENKGRLICSNFCHALVIKTPYKYFFHYLWQKLYENGNMFNFEGKTSGLRNLQLDSLCSSYWAFPRTKEYLEAFNVKIDSFLEERDNNKHTVKALEKQRSTVLPLLMNGQVSVKQLNNHLSAD